MVAAEMHGRIMQSGIYDASEKIYVSVLGSDKASIAEVSDYIFHRYPKYLVHMTGTDFTAYEWPALLKMQEVCKAQECDVWYVHTKGASNCRPDVPDYIQKNIRDWRGVMSHDILEKHCACKHILKSYGAVGSMVSLDQSSGIHFPGNFWWASSKHICGIPAISEGQLKDRMYAEAWVGKNPSSRYTSLKAMPPYDLYDFSGKCVPQGVLSGMLGAS